MGIRKAKAPKRRSRSNVTPVTTTQISYIDILDENGNVLKRAELEKDVRDPTGLMQIAFEEGTADEFVLVPMLARQQQLERRLFKDIQQVRGRRKVTPMNYPTV